MDNVLDLAFLTLTAIFIVWNVSALSRYLSYRRRATTAELTWLPPRPWFFNLCLGIGFFMLSMTFVSVFVLRRPLLAIGAQGLMAVYYTVAFPLSLRIRKGFYEKGIWTEGAFVPYGRVRNLSWLERPDVVLIVRKDAGPFGQLYSRLRVPGELFGQARRILASHIEDRTLRMEKSVLGLADDTPAQEQV